MPWIAFSVSVLTFVSPFMFLAAVRARGYLWAGMGRIFEVNNGQIRRTLVGGACPRPHCAGSLHLRRVVVETKQVLATDKDGRKYEKPKDVKRERLVCDRNIDHRFKFDATNLHDQQNG